MATTACDGRPRAHLGVRQPQHSPDVTYRCGCGATAPGAEIGVTGQARDWFCAPARQHVHVTTRHQRLGYRSHNSMPVPLTTWVTNCSMARSSIVPGPPVMACPFLAGWWAGGSGLPRRQRLSNLRRPAPGRLIHGKVFVVKEGMRGAGFTYGVKQQVDRPDLAVRASHGQVGTALGDVRVDSDHRAVPAGELGRENVGHGASMSLLIGHAHAIPAHALILASQRRSGRDSMARDSRAFALCLEP